MRRDTEEGPGPGGVGDAPEPPPPPPPPPPAGPGGDAGDPPPPPASDPRPPNPRPPGPVLGPPDDTPEPRIRRPRANGPTLAMSDTGENDAGGTFARPGTRGARPFRSGAFANNRLIGAGSRFGPGNPFSGGEGSGIGPLTEDDMYDSITRRLLG